MGSWSRPSLRARAHRRLSRIVNLLFAGGDPDAAFDGLQGWEHADLAGDQKPQRLDGEPHPSDVGDDRHPFALPRALAAEIEFIPGRAGKARAENVIEADLV